MGFNPYFHDADLVEREMKANSDAMAMAPEVQKVYFYGAGSSSPGLCAVIAEGLRNGFFTNAEVHVGHDLGWRGVQHIHRGASRDLHFGNRLQLMHVRWH